MSALPTLPPVPLFDPLLGRTLGVLALLPRQTPTTLSTFVARGRAAAESAAMGWTLIAISTVVFLIVATFLFLPLWRNRGQGDLSARDAAENVRAQHDDPGELKTILLLGLALPALVLAAVFVWSTVETNAQAQPFAVNDPDAETKADVLVIGHQWWWEVRYPQTGVVSANEVHIPVGRRVRIALRTDDVNHSFWIPQLAGKTDLVAGQTNTIWLEADTAGIYYGECGEFCGEQHAHMGLAVVADPPAGFTAWQAAEQAPAASVPPTLIPVMAGVTSSLGLGAGAPITGAPSGMTPGAVPGDTGVAAGYRTFAALGCASCHAVRGTEFAGRAGPDLTHLASRVTLAAGTMPNTRGDLAGWVADPQRAKPGNRMPTVPMTGAQLQAVVAYLESLR